MDVNEKKTKRDEVYQAFIKRTLELIEKEPVTDPRMEAEIRENVRVICNLDGFIS